MQVNVMTEVDIFVPQLEISVHGEGQLLQAAVANHDHSAFHGTFDPDGILIVLDIRIHLNISVENLGILKSLKELTAGMPFEMAFARL